MEMCYDGALVMPNNYAVVDEEEMMYVDGGYEVVVKHWTPSECSKMAVACTGETTATAYIRSALKSCNIPGAIGIVIKAFAAVWEGTMFVSSIIWGFGAAGDGCDLVVNVTGASYNSANIVTSAYIKVR